nr:sigma 54-interacting transcriptional regulator [uncultured Schaedlerella sp.]
MTRIAILLPYEDMAETARKVIHENHYEIDYIKVIESENAVNEARIAAEQGADIIIARGYQAQLIKEYTNIPVVEMRFHAQEIGLLLQRAKRLSHKERPVIGLIAFENMLCDLFHMEELFDVRLRIAYVERIEEVPDLLHGMKKEGVDCVIGGDTVNREAEKIGCLSIKFKATGESIGEAMERAKNMAYAVENEKRNAAQFETVLDTSFNGIIKINSAGRIIAINRLIENLLGKNMEDVKGELLYDMFPQIDKWIVDDILTGARENCSSSIEVRGRNWMFLAAPIQFDGQITGAILSLHAITEIVRKDRKLANDMLLHGFTAETHFSNIHTENKTMRRVLETAREYSLSDSPVLIYGETGTEYYQISEAIHNNSIRKGGPFVSVNISGLEEEKQMELLFGSRNGTLGTHPREKGAVIRANHGTLLIKDIEKLTIQAQYQLLRVILDGAVNRTDALPMDNIDVRIIAAAQKNLRYGVNKGLFQESLFYVLHGLTLEIPPLNRRSEDLRYYIDRYFKEFCRKYNKYLVITEGGYAQLAQFSWQGNKLQLKAFLERLVLTANKRSIAEGTIRTLFGELYPYVGEVGGEEKLVVYKTEEAVKISELLKKHRGNRKLAAEELGISTTTLWRKMNKYGIESKFGMD